MATLVNRKSYLCRRIHVCIDPRERQQVLMRFIDWSEIPAEPDVGP